jgi:glutamine synthetase
MLEKQAEIYEQYDVFPKSVIEGVARQLRSFNDEQLRDQVHCNKEKMQDLVDKYFHCG